MTAVALHASNSREGSVSVWARAKRPRSNQLAEIILMSSAEAGMSSTYFVDRHDQKSRGQQQKWCWSGLPL